MDLDTWMKKSIQVLDKKVANMGKTVSTLKEKYWNMKAKNDQGNWNPGGKKTNSGTEKI